MQIDLADIIRDPRCQPREALNTNLVMEYAQAMEEGDTFPPVTVFTDGEQSWLADGFHRVAAAEMAGRDPIEADIRPGTLRDAMLHAAGANATHGLRRSNADKRRAVEALLADDEWCTWSDREIARQCGVTHPFVARLRRELCGSGNDYHPIPTDDLPIPQMAADLSEGITAIGDNLLDVMLLLPEEQFRAWLAAEFGMDIDTARKFMQAARQRGSPSDIIESIAGNPVTTAQTKA